MRIATVSILSIFTCFSAFANARLPIVNVGAGSVSARAAFGEKVVTKSEPVVASVQKPTPLIEVAPLPKPAQTQKVVARAASVDAGEKIAKISGDVLTPKRPSSDLWARNEKPLRLPEPHEFAVLTEDFNLPEESIDTPMVVARAISDAPKTADFAIGKDTSELDAQIQKLVELQRAADQSVRLATVDTPVSEPVAKRESLQQRASNISSYDLKPTVAARAATRDVVKPRAQVRQVVAEPEPTVAVTRMVVPMQDDVVVRPVRSADQPKFASVETDMAKMSPTELKKAFKKTYLSENKHLSTYRIDDRFDVASDLSTTIEGFTAERDLTESGGVRPLEIKIGFRGDDSALSRDNYNLLSEYAGIVVSNPKRAIQISIPERATRSLDDRKLAARRLAIVEQVLKDTGVSDQRIMPVLSQRNDDGFVLRVISSDQYETMTQQKRDMFGDSVSKKTYKSMTW